MTTRGMIRSALAAALLFALACGKTVVFSGADLEPESRATLSVIRSVEITEIDGVVIDGSRIELAPGRYRVGFSARLRLDSVHPALAGAVEQLSCEMQIDIATAEEVKLFARWNVSRPDYIGSREQRTFHPQVGLHRSSAPAAEVFPQGICESIVDCRRLNRGSVTSKGCDRW